MHSLRLMQCITELTVTRQVCCLVYVSLGLYVCIVPDLVLRTATGSKAHYDVCGAAKGDRADLLSSRPSLQVLLKSNTVSLLQLQLPFQVLAPPLPFCQLPLKPLHAAGQLLMQVGDHSSLQASECGCCHAACPSEPYSAAASLLTKPLSVLLDDT